MQQHVTVTRSTCNSAYRVTTFPMFSNCNATHRTHTPGPPGAFRTNGPRQHECTVANNGQQRPPFEHTRRVSRPVHSMSAQLRTHTALSATEHNSSFQVIRQRANRTPPGATRPRRQRYVSVIVNLLHHNRAVAPKLPSAGSGPSWPLNNGSPSTPRVGKTFLPPLELPPESAAPRTGSA